jgi:hypothetical protein
MMEFDRSRIKAASWSLAYCLATAVLFFRGVVLLQHQFQIPFDLEAYHRPLSAFITDTLREQGHLPCREHRGGSSFVRFCYWDPPY